MQYEIDQFQEIIWTYYRENARDLPWRHAELDGTYSDYKIFVSEIMLQQTQVNRVIPKYVSFVRTFPTFAALATAPLAAVIREWVGLGYNRRAQYIQQAANIVVAEHDGKLPSNSSELLSLPGVGRNTAGALRVYAFNQPEVFVETNIRTVFIHHFFSGAEKVSDAELLPLIHQTLDIRRPREWYWALMDYGTMLKNSLGNTSRRSAHYVRQASFQGSVRQLRGAIIRMLSDGPMKYSDIIAHLDDSRAAAVIIALEKEGLICQKDAFILLSEA